jgi:hypothetical protein
MPEIMRGGLFNQWGAFHADLNAALLWTNETGGTIVLPRYAYKRVSFDDTSPSWQDLDLEKLFDVGYLVAQFNRKGIKLCFPYARSWIDKRKLPGLNIFLSRYPRVDPEHTWDAERLLNRTYEELKKYPDLSIQNRSVFYYCTH